MLKETATVVSTSADKAKVAIVRSEACGSCPAKSMCSAAASGNLNVLEVRNPVEAMPGEKVIIELQPAALVKATALVYLLPATTMLVGATAGWLKTGTDLGSIIGAVSGLAISALFLFLHADKRERGNGPTISHIMAS